MTVHARGIVGVQRGDPVTLDDLDGILPNQDEILAQISDVDERWEVDLGLGVGVLG